MKHYETVAGMPTRGVTYSKLLEHLREAEDCCILMGHLVRDESALTAKGWLAFGQMLELVRKQVTDLAIGKTRQ